MLHPQFIADQYYNFFQSSAVSCDSAIAADAGLEMLSLGGSAIDAAIATLLVNGMSNAHSMGIGGGFFMVYYNASTNTSYSIDAREIAPISGNFKHSIAVPTEILGYREVHKRWGQLPWKDLFGPAIKYARNGFKVSDALARAIGLVYDDLIERKMNILLKQLTNAETGQPYAEGELMKWPLLANTFEKLADGDFSSFFEDVCNDLKEAGCSVSMEDYEYYNVRVTKPLAFHVPPKSNGREPQHSYIVVSHPPPSGGCIVSLILNLLSGAIRQASPETLDDMEATARFCHRYIECAKLAYPAYEYVGDAAYHPEVNNAVEMMLNTSIGVLGGNLITDTASSNNFMKTYKELSNEIGAATISESNFSKLGLNVDYGGTAHACIVSMNGDAVSVTSSINHYFGSRVMGEKTGILWNNTLEDFAYADRERFRLAVANLPARHYISPGKRPVSAMSPVMVMSTPYKSSRPYDNIDKEIEIDENCLKLPRGSSVYMLCGGAGGSRIVGAVSYVLAQALLSPQPMLLSKAIAAPRVRHWIHSSGSSLLVLESGFCNQLRKRLEERGHKIENESERYLTVISGIQFVSNGERTPMPWLAVCDARKGGRPAGI